MKISGNGDGDQVTSMGFDANHIAACCILLLHGVLQLRYHAILVGWKNQRKHEFIPLFLKKKLEFIPIASGITSSMDKKENKKN